MRYYIIDSNVPLYIGSSKSAHNPPLHIHHHTELVYITDGSTVLKVCGNEYNLEKGDLAVIFPMQPHCYEGNERSWILINFIPGFCPDYRDLLLRCHPVENVLYGIQGGVIERLLSDADDEFKRGGEYSERITRGYLSSALGLILSRMELSEEKIRYYDAIEQIVRFCDAGYTSRLTLESISSELHLSRSYVSRLFSERMKVRFNDYINSLRVNHACNLLDNTDKSITDIALTSGFDSVRTFNRAFVKVWSMTPSEYRMGRNSGDKSALPNK